MVTTAAWAWDVLENGCCYYTFLYTLFCAPCARRVWLLARFARLGRDRASETVGHRDSQTTAAPCCEAWHVMDYCIGLGTLWILMRSEP